MCNSKWGVLATLAAAVSSGCSSQHLATGVVMPGTSIAMPYSGQENARSAPQAAPHTAIPKLRGFGDGTLGWPAPVHDDQAFTLLRAEQLEYRARDGQPDVARWEAQGWHGWDYDKLWIKTEGEKSVQGDSEVDIELQALYSRLIAPFWQFQTGVRYDSQWGPGPDLDRWFGVVGVQGVSPYEFEVEAAVFVSEDADASARLTASTDVLFTQRLILQARFETEVSMQTVREYQVGEGLNYVDLGFRLRYELKREFAPYLGVNWIRSFGETENMIQSEFGEASDLALVLGLSLWY